jgi:hypothetical protein
MKISNFSLPVFIICLLVLPFDGLLPPVLIEAKIRWGVNAA